MLIFDGRLVSSEFLPVNLEGVRGAFTTLPVYRQPLWLDRHLERLNQTLFELGLPRQVDPLQILDWLQRFAIQQQAVKIMVTADHLALQTRPLPQPPSAGYRLSCQPHPILPPAGHWKLLDRQGYLKAREKAVLSSCDDALLISPDGLVLETTVANIYLIRDGHLITPLLSGQVLPGIVRRFVAEQVHLEEHALSLQDFLAADLVFLSNSLIGIQRVSQIDDRRLAQKPNPVYSALENAYRAICEVVK